MPERPEIIAGGPGESSAPVAWTPNLLDGRPVERLDLDDDARDEPAPARSGAWRSVFAGVFVAEALAIAGLVFAIVPLFGLTVVSRLGAAIVVDPEAPETGDFGEADLALAITGLNAAMALAGVALGLVALLFGREMSRAARGTAGAAVLVGSVAAGISLLVAALGPGPGYF
jgi:hypothetical protein